MDVICMEVRGEASCGTPGEENILSVSQAVFIGECLEDGIDDPAAPEVERLPVHHHRLVGIPAEGVPVAVDHVDTVKVAEIGVLCAVVDDTTKKKAAAKDYIANIGY